MERWDERNYGPGSIEKINSYRLEMAHRIRIPTRLIRGRMSDVVSPEGAREFLDAVPHASYTDLAEAGHMVAGDRNDAFTQSVLEFLASLSPSPPER
jgi:non-heme chloroperoxidase